MRTNNAITNLLIASIPAGERERLEPYFEEVDLPMRTMLCTTGVEISHAVFPHDAVTSTLMELPEGDAVEVGLMGAEGVVGLDLLYGARTSVTTVTVQIPGRAVRIEAEPFLREVVKKRSGFYDLLLRYSRIFYGMVAQSGACNGSHALEQRLARWLLMIHDRVHRDQFPLTHEFAAYMLGVRRATVSEAANGLRLAGAIDYERGEMRVVDRPRLEASSCGCYRVMVDLEAALFGSRETVFEDGS